MPEQGNASSVTSIIFFFCMQCVSMRAQEPLITGCWVLLLLKFFFGDILVCCFATPGMKHTKTSLLEPSHCPGSLLSLSVLCYIFKIPSSGQVFMRRGQQVVPGPFTPSLSIPSHSQEL